MKYFFTICFLLSFINFSIAQENYIWETERFRSLRVIVDEDPLLPPIVQLNGRQQIEISFDEMGHNYSRLVYHIYHCSYDWNKSESESLFESDYLEGLNGQVLEDYDISFNTTQLYTHYRFKIPSEDVRLRLSGNYRVEIYDEEEYQESNAPQPLLKAEFCVVETGMNVQGEISTNTDIDFNCSHQQVTYGINYGSLRVIDPQKEIHTVVMQNRRIDNAVRNLEPNIRKANGIEYTHRKELIFPAGNEFRKFEIIDMHRPNLNVDYLRWFPPYFHSTLYPERIERNYVYDEDQNGNSILRNAEYDDEHITSEYLWVHFTLQAEEKIPGSDVYVCGLWTNGYWDDQCKMEWNENKKEYTASLYLKQGYYNYQYRQREEETLKGITQYTDGDFYETENEYNIMVYYRPQGGRYDKLVCYAVLLSK